jgi:hypothetical protein
MSARQSRWLCRSCQVGLTLHILRHGVDECSLDTGNALVDGLQLRVQHLPSAYVYARMHHAGGCEQESQRRPCISAANVKADIVPGGACSCAASYLIQVANHLVDDAWPGMCPGTACQVSSI